MTLLRQIESKVARLKVPQQKALLQFLNTMTPVPEGSQPKRKRKPNRAEVSAAIKAVAGMWEDRTDLPKDPVEAVKVLRARMWSRGRNG